MKNIFTLVFVLISLNLLAQMPVSHQAGVSYSHSASYYPAGGAATKDFNMCSSWNSAANGGWIQMDLGSPITLESLRWWVGMVPQGNVASELVEVSTNGTTWSLAANTSGPHTHLSEMKLNFSPTIPNVRYIRITQSGTPSWFAIYEMIVNEPYFAANIYNNMPPKVLDSTGKVLTGAIPGFPYKFICSKALTYQWYKDAALISGATNQEYTATALGNYTCNVTYANPNCGFATSSDPAILGPAPLPLNLMSFSVIEVNGVGKLDWEVEDVINFSQFEIEKSINGNDFEFVGKVQSHGNGDYHFEDANLSNGINYYRLKMVDNNLGYKFSEVKNLRATRDNSIQLFPNPVKDILIISTDLENYNFTIFNAMGQIVIQGKSFERKHIVSLQEFPAGFYSVQIHNNKNYISSKFMIQ